VPADRGAAEMAAIKSAGMKNASAKATTSVETTANEAAGKAATAAVKTTASAARRYTLGCSSKRNSPQQRDRDFTEHDYPLVQEDDALRPLGISLAAAETAVSNCRLDNNTSPFQKIGFGVTQKEHEKPDP